MRGMMDRSDYEAIALNYRRRFMKALSYVYYSSRLYTKKENETVVRHETKNKALQLLEEIDSNLYLIQVAVGFVNRDDLKKLFWSLEKSYPNSINAFIRIYNELSQTLQYDEIKMSTKDLLLEITGGKDIKSDDNIGTTLDSFAVYPFWPAQAREDWGYHIFDKEEGDIKQYQKHCQHLKTIYKG